MCFGAFGGGIHNSGTLTVLNSTLSHNTAGNYGYGGGIDNGGTLTVLNSTLSDNSAGYEGGGIHNTGMLKILNSTLFDNDSNVGGGINNDGKLTVINSTLSSNKAQLGGGIYNSEGTLTIINSTLSGNSAQSVVGGTGGGIYNYSNGSVNLANTLIANNTAQTSGAQCVGTIIDNGHNLDSGDTCGFSSTKGSLSNTDPLLKPLADNGGPTQTMALLPGSPAINAGSNALIPAGITTDQRGAGFPRIVGGTVDIGAVEKEGSGYSLTVTKIGGNGTVTSTPAGINCGATCSANFNSGTQVTLAAKADAGYSFTGWAGDCNGATCTVTMTTNRNVTALFAKLPTSYALTVTKAGAGLGTVTSSPDGINCGADCSQPYNPGTTVTLTATVTAGSVFAGWTGCTTVNGTKCTVVMNANKTVKATFNRPVLTVAKTGSGSGLITGPGIHCGVDCTEPYNLSVPPRMVTLTAAPSAGSTFAGWSGCTTVNGTACTVAVSASKTVKATFNTTTPGTYALTIYKIGTGLGTVASNPAGVSCGGVCVANFASGVTVTLTATATTGSTFLGWVGCTPLTANPKQCTVAMSAARIVTARFNTTTPGTYALAVTKAGTGSGIVTSSPAGINCGTSCVANFTSGRTVTLTAAPATGSTFLGWVGCTPVTANPKRCTVAMSAARIVIARFNASTPTAVSLDSGEYHTCGVRSDGTVVCWGYNDSGQATPPADRFTQVSAGRSHTCGLKSDGTVVCWGDNYSGQATPPASRFTQVSAGGAYTCGVRSDGTVVCWGYNDSGQATPPAGRFTQVSAGHEHTCGVKSDGTVACWGYNGKGRATPPAGRFTQVSAGGTHTCGVKSDSAVACWGNDYDGQATPPAGRFTQVSAGGSYTCGVKSDSTVACWGYNGKGQATPPAGRFTQVSTGNVHTCGVKSDGAAICWGNNDDGELGPTLTVTKAGTGAGTVTSNPAGIACGSDCRESYAPFPTPVVVTLTATPAVGSTFAGWSGACSGTAATCKVTMSIARSVAATFTK
jgi:uncharacterized repeat protein (TIGR02543 family)